MKSTKLHRFISIIAVALALTRQLSAQPTLPDLTQSQLVQRDRLAPPISQREWARGYLTGHEQGFWTGIRDARAGLTPSHFRLPPPNVRLTPYSHGHLIGFIEGYRKGFAYIW